VTVILLPLGIPVLMVARWLLTRAVQLMLPRSLAHPIDEVAKTAKKKGRKAKAVTSDAVGDISKKARKAARNTRKRVA